MRIAFCLGLLLTIGWSCSFAGAASPQTPPAAGETRVSIVDGKWYINGDVTYPGTKAEGLLMNVRMVNATFEDRGRPEFDVEANTAAFLAEVPDYAAHGVRAFTLCLQGGMPGYEGAVNSAFAPNGSLRQDYLQRIRRVIDACDRQGIVVILGCYYQRQSAILRDEKAVRTGLVNVVKWIRDSKLTNVVLETANEYPHGGFVHDVVRSPEGQADLLRLAKRTWPQLLVSASGYGDGKSHSQVIEAADFLLIHFNGTPVEKIPERIAALRKFGKPIACNEDDKTGRTAAKAAELCVENGASWGLMLKQINQYQPFAFHGAADDPLVYATLKELTTPPALTQTESLWQVAKTKQGIHRFSTLITAQQVRDHLGIEDGIDAAIDWCKKTAVTRVFIETFRSDYLAPRENLKRAKERFLAAGIGVSGCVTPTIVGKKSTGWNIISCYTDAATQDHLREIFQYTAEFFDEIMIDDFWFTDCECSECDAARQAKTVTIGDKTYAVTGDTWEDYRCELMVRLSRDRILAAAQRVNPKAKLIIKYPQWYDRFHERGYEVVRETADFDLIWVGTETRDYDNSRWGGTPQYEGYFLMRWLGGIGGEKCGGGWFDPYGTTEKTYVEQARQTVLAGAKESLLFCYGALQENTGPANVQALRACIPELLEVAEEVGRRQIVGVAAYKPPNSHPEKESRVFDFLGMMGVPLVPCHEFPTDAKAAFFSVHALKDPNLPEKLSKLIARGVPVLVTDGLAQRLEGRVQLDAPNVRVLPVNGSPKSLLELPQDELDAIRQPLLKPLGRTFEAPNRVALYLFADGTWVVENFGDEPATVRLDDAEMEIAARGWRYDWDQDAVRKKAK